MEEKKSFLESLNLLLIGAVIGAVIAACLTAYSYIKEDARQSKIIEAYEQYYINTETLLDSIDGTHNLDLMDTDLESDYGADYLHAKSVVDNLTNQ